MALAKLKAPDRIYASQAGHLRSSSRNLEIVQPETSRLCNNSPAYHGHERSALPFPRMRLRELEYAKPRNGPYNSTMIAPLSLLTMLLLSKRQPVVA